MRRPLLLALLVLALIPGAAMPVAAASPATASVATTDDGQALGRGDHGVRIRRLQERLVELRYFLGDVDGVYGYLTEQAVLAFQKVNGLHRDGVVGAATAAALLHPRRPAARTSAPVALEVVQDAQVVLLVKDGRVRRILNAATGTGSTPTPNGRYRVYRQINGWRTSPLGQLYRPKYFHQGYAVHGSLSVPAYPASHGCVRLNLASTDFLWPRVPVGTRVWIYQAMRY